MTEELPNAILQMMKFLKIGCAVFLVLCVLTAGFFVFLYRNGDSVDRAAIDTEMRLVGTRIGLCNEECISTWLTEYHGEAPGHQVMITFVSFGISNTNLFLKILRDLPTDSIEKVVDRVSAAVSDVGLEKEFNISFGFGPESLKVRVVD